MKEEILASISAKHESALKSLSAKCTSLQANMDILGKNWQDLKDDKFKMAKAKKLNDIQASKFCCFDYIFIMSS